MDLDIEGFSATHSTRCHGISAHPRLARRRGKERRGTPLIATNLGRDHMTATRVFSVECGFIFKISNITDQL
jgi:hypothetical protein